MGTLITFSGIDGAGKTTQTRLLAKYLKSKKKKFIFTESMFTYFLLGPLVKIFRKTTNSPSGGPVTMNKNAYARLWFLLAFVDIWLGYFFKAIPLIYKNDIVVADRYYADIWANLLYYGYLPKSAFKFFAKILPRADISFIFVVNPLKVRKREEDFPLKYYQDQAKIYNRLGNLIPFYSLNANQKPEVVFSEIQKVIETTMSSK